MKTYEFLCGGDGGAWECLVDVELTDDEVARLTEYAERNDTMFPDDSIMDIYQKVSDALDQQCDDSIDNMYDIEIRIPYEFREDL